MTIRSPLTYSENISLVDSLKTRKIIEAWKTAFGIDITDEMKGYSDIYLYRCNDTGLEFYYPLDVYGSNRLYSQLQQFDWYYMPHKWEHDMALKVLGDRKRVLEIGCGFGGFLELAKKHGICVEGIETNRQAVLVAKSKGLNVRDQNLNDVIIENAGTYDAVCGFQVLEHIANPKEILEQAINLLKKGGVLIMCVPNNDGFIKYDKFGLLNQPPHHMLRWSKKSLMSLTRLFNLKIKCAAYEPLQAYHLDWYLNVQLGRLMKIFPFWKRLQSLRQFISCFLKESKIYKYFHGVNIFVCFEKIS